jgi:heme-degrading monooxygenase HmoA
LKSILARVASWEFKPDQRKSGFELLENSVLELVRRTEGFRGSLTLLSRDDANLGIIIILWNSEESEKVYADGVFKVTTQNLEPFVTGPPEVTHHTVYSVELKQ